MKVQDKRSTKGGKLKEKESEEEAVTAESENAGETGET